MDKGDTQADAADGKAAHKMDPTLNSLSGESGGGAYPNPHSKTSKDNPGGGAAYETDDVGEAAGATSQSGYHGSGKAGDQDFSGQS